MPPEKRDYQVDEPTKENDQNEPLEFIIVGSGQVVDKYWMPANLDKLVSVIGIVSLENENNFRTRNNKYDGDFASRNTHKEIVDYIEQMISKYPSAHIALAVPADIRLTLLIEILSRDSVPATSLIFLEKPYARTADEIATYRELVKNHSNRLHFSGKYANGRADILIKHLPDNQVPDRITARLIEGGDYFNVVKLRLMEVGTHPYMIDGPELDLGFHLTDIITVAADTFGQFDSFDIISVKDASEEIDRFEPGFGFTAELVLHTKSGKCINFSLVAGKRDGQNERFVEFDYENERYRQLYTVGHASDPVQIHLKNGIIKNEDYKTIEEHPERYNYYARELHKNVFGSQTQEDQFRSLYITEVMIQIRAIRLAQSQAS